MGREFFITESCRKKISRMIKKNPVLGKALENKIGAVTYNPEHFKPLRYSDSKMRRVHVLKSFVLIYEIRNDVVHIIDFDHHDRFYRR
jgi:mRNA-degrading endonuclease RelE of RelBE toxin-antitoxin system